MKNPLLSYPQLVKKTSILSKLHQIMGKKNKQDAIFPPLFREKTTALVPIFCKKRPFSQKTFCYHAHIMSKKRPSSQKHGASCHLHQFFYEKTPAVMQIFGQNASSLPKLHYTIGYKSQKYTLFPIFHTKSNALMIFCNKTSNL